MKKEFKSKISTSAIIGEGAAGDQVDVNIGHSSVVRAGTIIYNKVYTGTHFQTGHNVVVRSDTKIGKHVVLGTNTVVDGNVVIGDFVKIETNCYIPTHVSIGSRVFFGPGVVLTNDRIPLKQRALYKPEGPVIEDGVTLGAGVVIMPGVRVGAGSFVAAGSLVTKDVPPASFVKGHPARFSELPGDLRETNIALSWMEYIDE